MLWKMAFKEGGVNCESILVKNFNSFSNLLAHQPFCELLQLTYLDRVTEVPIKNLVKLVYLHKRLTPKHFFQVDGRESCQKRVRFGLWWLGRRFVLFFSGVEYVV